MSKQSKAWMRLFLQKLHEQSLEVRPTKLMKRSLFWKQFSYACSQSYCTQTAERQLSSWLSTTAVNFAWGCFSSADALSISSLLPDCMLPFSFYHAKCFSTLTFSTLCTWSAADMTLNLFCYIHGLQSWVDCFVPKWVSLHKDTCHPANWYAMQHPNEIYLQVIFIDFQQQIHIFCLYTN